MECKRGEIFEYNGEWYQCVESHGDICDGCAGYWSDYVCNSLSLGNCEGKIFKKLEKARKPFTIAGKLYQHYKVFDIDKVCGNGLLWVHDYKAKTVTIEIKQNKDMEEDREYSEEEFKNNPRFQHHKNIEQVNNMKKMKPFNLEQAKAGKPVCTRDGRKARIICFDAKGKQPIIALFEREKSDEVIIQTYNDDGSYYGLEKEDNRDLMMLLEKKEAWVNLYPCDCMGQKRYPTKEEALKNAVSDVIATVKIEWEE